MSAQTDTGDALLTLRASDSGEPLKIAVRILERRENFGRVDVLIVPVCGDGQVWVSETRLETDSR